MVGYLDTGDPTTTTVTILGLPSQLTSGYDVYVYMLGGTSVGRGGGYRILDNQGATLRDYLVGDPPVKPDVHSRDLGVTHDDKGDYLIFRGLTAASITIEATTEAPHGLVRAPINAIQLVAATRDTAAPSVPANLATNLVGAHFVDLKWDAATDTSGLVLYYEIDRGGVVVGKTAATTFRDTAVLPSTPYTYKVRAVDDSINASAYGATLAVTTTGETQSAGYLKFEVWRGMDNGTLVSLLTDWIAALNDPNLVSYTPTFDSRPVYPDDSHEQYGAVVSGWLTPAENSGYTFFLRSDDASELWLSTTDQEAGLVKIAEQTACCNAFTEPDGIVTYTSLPINLQAGQRYFVKLYYKEGGGGDYGQVAWRKAGDTTSAGSLTPIPGLYLSSMVDPAGASVTITTQPANTTATEGTTATFSVAASITSPYATTPAYQWYRNGQFISGATDASITTAEVTTAADQGAKYKVTASVPGASKTSDEVTLTVTDDTVAPKIVAVKATSISSLVVTFDEPIDQASAQTIGNYSLSGGATISAAAATGSAVLLSTAGLTVGNSYTITVGGVKDRFDNAVPAGTTFAFVVNVVTYSDVILADGPIAFYRFEETTGQMTVNLGTAGTVADGLWKTGLGPDDSVPTDVSWAEGPRPGSFLGFDSGNKAGMFHGTDGQLWVDAQQQLLNSLAAFSLEYWVAPSNRLGNPTYFGTRIGIVGQNDAIEYGFIDNNTIQIWTPGGGSLDTDYNFADGEWHHVATIADGRSIKNYFDGKQVGSGGSTAANYGTSTYNVHIGGGGAFDATGNFFTGAIDEVAIFNKAIPAARIAAHFKAGKEGGESPSVEPKITGIARQGANVTITYDGILTSASKANGPTWTDVAGAPSGTAQTYTAPATAAEQYFRTRK
jgi:hypothetical protein